MLKPIAFIIFVSVCLSNVIILVQACLKINANVNNANENNATSIITTLSTTLKIKPTNQEKSTKSSSQHYFFDFSSFGEISIYDVVFFENYLYITLMVGNSEDSFLVKSDVNGNFTKYKELPIDSFEATSVGFFAVSSWFNRISKLDFNLEIVKSISSCDGVSSSCLMYPFAISYDSATERLYVGDASKTVYIFDTDLVQVDYFSPNITLDINDAYYVRLAYKYKSLLYVTIDRNTIHVFNNSVLVKTYYDICDTAQQTPKLAFDDDTFYVACYFDKMVMKYNFDGTLNRSISTLNTPLYITIDNNSRLYVTSVSRQGSGIEVISV